MNSLGPHRRRCLPLWPASSDKQFLITPWWRRTSESRPFQQCSEECVILEAKFRGGGKSVFIQSRPDSNRDSPHCGQTSNQLVICPFSCSDCCKSPNPLNTARKKRNRRSVILFPSLWEAWLLNNVHIDGEAADPGVLFCDSFIRTRVWHHLSVVDAQHLSDARPEDQEDRLDFIIRVNPSTMPERRIKPE